MSPDLTALPFDHYQRYASVARMVGSVCGGSAKVLEVGANRQQLLGSFLPVAKVTYTDIEAQAGIPDFVVADATALPFADRSFDAVVSLDVLEHIPVDLRELALREMARVAARVVVVCCPLDQPWVHAAEASADALWRRHFRTSYPWLDEHNEHGLVDAGATAATLGIAGLQVVRFGHGDAALWADLMGAHFAKEVVTELSPVVAAMDHYYNRFVFEGDVSDRAYREVFVGLRDVDDVVAVRRAIPQADEGLAGRLAALRSAAKALAEVVARVARAESEWEVTSASVQRLEQELGEVRSRLHASGLALEASERRGVEQLRRADVGDRKLFELQHQLDDARRLVVLEKERAATELCVAQEALQAAQARVAEQMLRCERGEDALASLRDALEASERRGVEQLQRADNADRRLGETETTLHEVKVALQAEREERSRAEAEMSSTLGALRQALDRVQGERDGLRLDLGELSTRWDALSAELIEVRASAAEYRGHCERLQMRVSGLQRRQRWTMATLLAVAVLAAAAYFL